MQWHLETGPPVRIKQATNYPWEGSVDFAVDTPTPAEFTLFLRIPAWSKDTRLTVNGETQTSRPGEFAQIHRLWKKGDKVQLVLDMKPRLTESNALVRENVGRVAVERGPLVYCLEKPDQTLNASLFDESLIVDGQSRFTENFRKDLLDGVLVMEHKGLATARPLEDDPLYRDFALAKPNGTKPATLTFIPYYAWGNRGQQEMEVWVPVVSSVRRAAR